MKEIIDNLISIALKRNVPITDIRLDLNSYSEFKQDLEEYFSTDIEDLNKYESYDISIEREQWINKIYIEIT